MADAERTDLFRYLAAEESDDYIAIMNLFVGTLLTDMSAAEVHTALGERGANIDVDRVDARCRQLAAWGNLVPSLRDARVTTVADYLRSRSRYQLSKLGGRVHYSAIEVLNASDGAREVARELLAQIAESLGRVAFALADTSRPVDEDAIAGEVTAIFNNQQLFTASVRDFYAYLAAVLSRYDLGGEEYAQFKLLLLDYVDLIKADVDRHAPAVAARLRILAPLTGHLLEVLDSVRGLTLPDGTSVERSHGRTRSDWDELARWYGSDGAYSGPEQLRAAASRALGQLIANAKRLLDTSGTGFSRRADLLRLARWFADSDDDAAHRLYAASFAAYPSRHLLLGPEEVDPRIGTTTSWWHSDPVDVPLSLRERGSRSMRGRSSRVPDPSADRRKLTADAQREALERHDAAAELIAAGRLHQARISPAARELLLDQLATLLSLHLTETRDSDLELLLTAFDGADTVLHSSDGDTTIHGLTLIASRASDPALQRQAAW